MTTGSNGREPDQLPPEQAWPTTPVPSGANGSSASSTGRSTTVSLGDFFGLLRRRLITFLVCFVLCLLAAFVVLQLAPKKYDARSAVKVAPVVAAGDTGAAKDISTITESRIVTSTAVAAHAATALHFHGSLDDLLSHVSVSSPLNSQLIYITYTAGGPRAAASGANAFAEAYLAYRRSVGEGILTDQSRLLAAKITALGDQLNQLGPKAPAGQRSALQSQIDNLNGKLYTVSTTVVVPGQVVGVAQRPSAPSSPKKVLYIAGGLLLGLIAGVVASVVRDRRDDDLHGPTDLELSIGAPVLATVNARTRRDDVPAVAVGALPQGLSSPDEVDAYRSLATKLRTPILGKGSNTFVLVRGGVAREEHAPLNLAAMFARQGVQTALVTTERGLTHATALFDDEHPAPHNLDEGLSPVPSIPNLWLLSLGPEDEMDSTISMQRAKVEEMFTLVDIVLLDGVNLELPSSVLALSQLTNTAVVVAVDRRTTHAELARSIRELAQVGTRPLGSVLFVRRALRIADWMRIPGRKNG